MGLDSGSRLGRYEILALLGAGGMGEVYAAHDTRLDRDVAIKILTPSLSSDASALARFEREAKAIAALSHPAILAIHEFAIQDGTAYVVTELLSGQTLRHRLAAGALSVRTAIDFAAQVADGLAAAHDKGLVHRDVKPENLFVTVEGRAKILDFGLVHRGPLEPDGTTVTISPPTMPGTILGTVGYMSPEQALGRPVDFRSDQFSLGAVIYEMLSGRRPFARPSTPATLSAIVHDDPAPLGTVNAGVPAPLRWIVERCLAKDPAARYASTHDLARELRTLLEHLPEASDSRDLAPAARPTSAARAVEGSRRRKVALAAAAVGFVMLLGAGIYFVSFVPSGREPTATIESLAILPLENASKDPQTEYLSDGITEALINSLSRLPALKVLARTTVFRYKGTQDPIKAARELRVRALLTGKIMLHGDTLTIQADLVDVASGAQLWGERYNRKLSDLLTIQEEIATRISETLRPRFSGEQQRRVARRSTNDPEAYQLYLRARFQLNKLTEKDLRGGIEYLQQAIARDPGFALAYAGLSDTYGILGQTFVPQTDVAALAKAAFEKALELDDTLPEGHLAHGAHSLFYDWNWSVADRELRRAIELNPNLATAHDVHGQLLAALGRFDDAVRENQLAVELDPLSPLSGSNLAVIYYYARQHDRAIDQCRKTLELNPDYFFASLYKGSAHTQRRDYQEAIAELVKTRDLAGGLAPATAELAYVYAISGQRPLAQKMLRELEGLAARGHIDPYYIAVAHLGLDELGETFGWLDKAFEERSFWLVSLNVEPKFDRVRHDPRFAAVQRRLGFPEIVSPERPQKSNIVTTAMGTANLLRAEVEPTRVAAQSPRNPAPTAARALR
jgi:serine/threonine-protein kinase